MRALALFLFAVACHAETARSVTLAEPPRTPPPRPVKAPPRAGSVEQFLLAGCRRTDSPVLIDCKDARIDDISECQQPMYVLDVHFEPAAAMVECHVAARDDQRGGVRRTGCMFQSDVRLLAAIGDGFEMIRSAQELAKKFAPVSSRAEAIAFAVALTGGEAIPPNSPMARNGAVTEVADEPDGFRVRLFHHQVCGCSHPTYAVEHAVSRDGLVREVSRKVAWEDPSREGLCVD